MTAESITDRTIDQMLARPEMHAKTPEILEAVVLRLLELDEMSKLPPQRGDHHIIDLVANLGDDQRVVNPSRGFISKYLNDASFTRQHTYWQSDEARIELVAR